MPTTKELVANKPLTGPELATIIQRDVARLCDGSGFLAGQTAYSQVSYEVRLTLLLNQPTMPTATDLTQSRTQATDAVTAHPELAALAPHPLPAPAIVSATQVVRDISSPNLARIEHSLPITVEVLGGDGHKREELIDYLPQDVGMAREDFKEPDLTDVSAEARKELGL
jgi:hypothetical protein